MHNLLLAPEGHGAKRHKSDPTQARGTAEPAPLRDVPDGARANVYESREEPREDGRFERSISEVDGHWRGPPGDSSKPVGRNCKGRGHQANPGDGVALFRRSTGPSNRERTGREEPEPELPQGMELSRGIVRPPPDGYCSVSEGLVSDLAPF